MPNRELFTLRGELLLGKLRNDQTPTQKGVAVPVAKEPSLAEQKDRERSSSKPPPAESSVQEPAEPQSTPQQRRRGRKRLHPDIELLHKSRRAWASKSLYKGLSEEQIAIAATSVHQALRMAREGASPEEIGKMEDEFLLKIYPGMTLEEARETARETTQKNLNDIVL
jgi:hypothetical protein